MLGLCPCLRLLKVSFSSLVSAHRARERDKEHTRKVCSGKNRWALPPGKGRRHSLLPPAFLWVLWTSPGLGTVPAFL